MFLFVLAVWLWNVWLGVMALKAYNIWKSQEGYGPLILNDDEPVDVNKFD